MSHKQQFIMKIDENQLLRSCECKTTLPPNKGFIKLFTATLIMIKFTAYGQENSVLQHHVYSYLNAGSVLICLEYFQSYKLLPPAYVWHFLKCPVANRNKVEQNKAVIY